MDYIKAAEEETINIQDFFIDDCYEYSDYKNYRAEVARVLIRTCQHLKLAEFIMCAQKIRNIPYVELLEYAIEMQNKKAQLLLLDHVHEYTLSDKLFETFYNNRPYLFWLSDHYDFPATQTVFDIMNKDHKVSKKAKIILNGYSDTIWEIIEEESGLHLQGCIDITKMIEDDNGDLMKIFCRMFRRRDTVVTSLLYFVCYKDSPQCFDILTKETNLPLIECVKQAFDHESIYIITDHKKQWDVDLKHIDSMVIFNELKHNQIALKAFKYLFTYQEIKSKTNDDDDQSFKINMQHILLSFPLMVFIMMNILCIGHVYFRIAFSILLFLIVLVFCSDIGDHLDVDNDPFVNMYW